MKKLFSVLLVFLFLGGLISYAQTGQTGKIVVKVTDEKGAILPGVAVTITSTSMVIDKMTRVTDINGVVRFPVLNPGVYTVKAELEGFLPVLRKNVIVNAGTATSITIPLKLGELKEEVVVTAKSPTVDRQNVTKTTTLDNEFIKTIPTTRTLGDYFNMVPGVTDDTSHGSSVRDNSYNVDGVNVGDVSVGTEALFFSVDTVEEISVQAGGLPAEYGQVRGAVVNVVSKSGGNEFHGKLNMFYRGENFQSDNTKGTPLEGQKSGFKYEMEPGFSLGGPIIKDKLWFFINASFWKQSRIVSGFPYDKDEEVGVDQFRPYPYVKLSYQPNQDNKIIVSYRYSDIRRNNRGASRFNTEDTTFEQVTPTHVFNFHYTKFFGSDFYTSLKFFVYKSKFNMLAKNDEPNYYDLITYLNRGSSGYSDYNIRNRYSVKFDGTFFVENLLGAHEIKIGSEFVVGDDSRELKFNDGSKGWSFVYTIYQMPYLGYHYEPYNQKNKVINIAAYLQDTWNVNDRLTANIGLRYENMRGIWPSQMQDEGTKTIFGYTYNRAVEKTTTAYVWNTLSPRVGIVYDVMGDGKTVIKASFSRYYMANLTQWVARGNPNGFVYWGGLIDNNENLVALTGIGLAGPQFVPKYGYKDFKYKAPYLDEFIIGLEKEIHEDWSIGIRYIRKWDRDLMEDADANYLNIDKLLSSGEYEWYNYEPVKVTDPYDGSIITFWNKTKVLPANLYLINPPDAKRDYKGLELTLTKRYSNRWQMQASYVYAKSTGMIGTDFNASWSGTDLYQNPNAHINVYGRFPLERRHQFKLQGVVRGPLGINIGGYYRYLSGHRYTRTVNSKELGIDLTQGDETIYAEQRGSRALPDLSILDLRVEKAFRVSNVVFTIFSDVFNVFNANKAISVYASSSSKTYNFGEMSAIQNPRIFRVGARFEF